MAMNYSKEFATAFGAIIHSYARIEAYIKYILSDRLNTSVEDIWIIAEPYGALALRNVAKALVDSAQPTMKDADTIKGLIGEFGAFSKLRNYIAHYVWIDGYKPGSIRPTGVDIRDRKAKLIGLDPAEPDYTITDLADQAVKIERLEHRFHVYLETSGIFERIEAKIEAIPRYPTTTHQTQLAPPQASQE